MDIYLLGYKAPSDSQLISKGRILQSKQKVGSKRSHTDKNKSPKKKQNNSSSLLSSIFSEDSTESSESDVSPSRKKLAKKHIPVNQSDEDEEDLKDSDEDDQDDFAVLSNKLCTSNSKSTSGRDNNVFSPNSISSSPINSQVNKSGNNAITMSTILETSCDESNMDVENTITADATGIILC